MKPLLSPVRPSSRRRSSVDLRGLLGGGSSPTVTPAARLVADPNPDQLAHAAHVARRATFGATPELVRTIAQLTPARWLETQLASDEVPDREVDAVLARFPGLGLSTAATRDRVAAHQVRPEALTDGLVQATVVRAAWSRRQLLEVMTDLWSNHFHVPADGSTWDSRADYDRTVRENALGRFEDLLVAVTTHPAMLRSMGTDLSSPSRPDEHHGRELLDLHTVGADAGATEAEVLDSARLLTGLTLDPGTGELVYRADRRYVGAVSVLGFEHRNADAEAGYGVLVAYLQRLARRRETASRIARLLAVRFVADQPPAALVARLARTYLETGTSIPAVLRALFASPEFSHPSAVRVRRPMEDLLGAVRALGVQPDREGVRGIDGLYWLLDGLGQAPLGAPGPAGYSARGSDWLSASGLVARWNAHLGLAGGWWPDGLRYPGWRSLLPEDLPRSYADVLDALSRRILLRSLSDADRTAICAAVGRTPSAPVTAAALGTDAPQLIALLLDSPAHCLC